MKRIFPILAFVLLTLSSFAQRGDYKFGGYTEERKVISVTEFFQTLQEKNEDSSIENIVFRNIEVKLTLPIDCRFGNCRDGDIAMSYIPGFNWMGKSDSSERYVFTKPLVFSNCLLTDFGLSFFNCEFQKPIKIGHCQAKPWIRFDSCDVHSIRIQEETKTDWLILKKSSIGDKYSVFETEVTYFEIQDCKFLEREDEKYHRGMRFPSLIVTSCDIQDFKVESSTFPLTTPDSIWSPSILLSECYMSHLEIVEVNCEGMQWGHSEVSISANLESIEFSKGLLMEAVGFPEFKTSIEWRQLAGGKLLTQRFGNKALNKDSVVKGNSRIAFKNLIANYNILYNLYKVRNDRESANECYAEMKRLETDVIEKTFRRQKNFEWYFRWKLNQFLNFFTDYGTNPAKAVIKSIWVILIFSIFYLFFPSDWDVSNRSTLLKRMKELVSKNREKSFMATLGFVSYGGFIHVLNAITLSLNAFTTLGFGDIPTHGAARYVTIVQGFIGWFLLTIFSVSLINQVLG